MKITFIISSLKSGGAERVLTGLANYWSKKGYDISIIKYQPGDSFYPIDSKIFVHTINFENRSKLGRTFFLIKEIRRKISQISPDIVISFIDKTNILSIFATQGLNTKLIISERTNPEVLRINKFWDVLRKLFYKKADALVVQTNFIKNWSIKVMPTEKVFIIPNALDEIRRNSILSLTRKKSKTNVIATMGRLSYEKGHDLLIESFKVLSQKFPDLHLEIIGDGPLKEKLINKVNELDISQKVTFHGHLKNPFPILNDADIFVLPSRVEGFPNALLEAMALGLPSISFDCNYGPSDLITHNENGFLVDCENIGMMAKQIDALLSDEIQMEKVSSNSRYVLTDFSEDKIMKKWDEVIQNIVSSGKD